MNRGKILILLALVALTTSCSNDQPDTSQPTTASATADPAIINENKELKEKIAALTKEIETLKNEPGQLLKLAQDNAESNPATAKDKIATLLSKYPTTAEAETAKKLLTTIEATESKEAIAKKAEEEKKKSEEKQRLAKALSNTKTKIDEVQEITWYYAKTTTEYTDTNEIYAYLGKKEEAPPWLRLNFQYAGDDWLFIDRYIFKVDGETYTIETEYGEVERDNGGGGVWEWYDFGATSTDIDMLRAIATSTKTVLRYEGDQYYKDRTITATEKKALLTILDAYTALGGL